MPNKLICCVSLPPATILSVPISDFAIANEELAREDMDGYFPCCGKNICRGCVYSFGQTGNGDKCPFCNSDRADKTLEEIVADIMKRVEANDAASIYVLANFNYHGVRGFQQDHAKAIELFTKSADLGCSQAHSSLGDIYHEGGNMKKSKSHNEAAAMAGNEVARCILGNREAQSGNMERAVKHWTIAASAGCFLAMDNMLIALKKHDVSKETIDTTLTAYNNSCAEVKSKDRDACLQVMMERQRE
jgi:TPR repeat protein